MKLRLQRPRRKASHRKRTRERQYRHPGRSDRRLADTLQRQEIARLRREHERSGGGPLLAQIGTLRDELERAAPMPRIPSSEKLHNRAPKVPLTAHQLRRFARKREEQEKATRRKGRR